MEKMGYRFVTAMFKILLLAVTTLGTHAKAVTFEVLHEFGKRDGTPNGADGRPTGGIAVTPDGSVYGVSWRYFAVDGVAVYKDLLWRWSNSKFKVLYEFPWGMSSASLVSDAEGRVYGTSAHSRSTEPGWPGAAWVFDPVQGVRQLPFSLAHGDVNPSNGLVRDSHGNFYGSTYGDSVSTHGAIYKIDPAFTTITTLRPWGEFSSEGSGAISAFELVEARLFGTQFYGGKNSLGAAFSIRTDGSDFQSRAFEQGRSPSSGLTYDGLDRLWGASLRLAPTYNPGLIYTIDRRGRYHIQERLTPETPTSISDKFLLGMDGMLYNTSDSGPRGKFTGQVFQLNPSTGAMTTVHAFRADHRDGQVPVGPLVQDASGALYGVTRYGGANNTGVLYKISP